MTINLAFGSTIFCMSLSVRKVFSVVIHLNRYSTTETIAKSESLHAKKWYPGEVSNTLVSITVFIRYILRANKKVLIRLHLRRLTCTGKFTGFYVMNVFKAI